jgi:hypothetical protein
MRATRSLPGRRGHTVEGIHKEETMQRQILLAAALVLAGCAGYTSAELAYSEPPAYDYEYDVPVDQVVIVTREVLVDGGWTVFRVEQSGPNRIIWARRGDDEQVRVLATPHGQRVGVRGVWEVRDRGDGDGNEHGNHGRGRWVKRGPPPKEIFDNIDHRLRRH